MLSIFSCACWPHMYLLWRNVYLVFLSFSFLLSFSFPLSFLCFFVSFLSFLSFSFLPSFLPFSLSLFLSLSLSHPHALCADWTHSFTVTQAAAAKFLTHCTTAGTPFCHFLIELCLLLLLIALLLLLFVLWTTYLFLRFHLFTSICPCQKFGYIVELCSSHYLSHLSKLPPTVSTDLDPTEVPGLSVGSYPNRQTSLCPGRKAPACQIMLSSVSSDQRIFFCQPCPAMSTGQ